MLHAILVVPTKRRPQVIAMIWSRLKKSAETLLADSLKGKVQYHTTRYGSGANDRLRRGWVTYEGREIAVFSNSIRAQEGPMHVETGISAETPVAIAPEPQVKFSRDEFVAALEEIVSLPVEAALSSADPLLRALAMLDRRLGKRRLITMEAGPEEHELIRTFYCLRCKVEGIRLRTTRESSNGGN